MAHQLTEKPATIPTNCSPTKAFAADLFGVRHPILPFKGAFKACLRGVTGEIQGSWLVFDSV